MNSILSIRAYYSENVINEYENMKWREFSKEVDSREASVSESCRAQVSVDLRCDQDGRAGLTQIRANNKPYSWNTDAYTQLSVLFQQQLVAMVEVSFISANRSHDSNVDARTWTPTNLYKT